MVRFENCKTFVKFIFQNFDNFSYNPRKLYKHKKLDPAWLIVKNKKVIKNIKNMLNASQNILLMSAFGYFSTTFDLENAFYFCFDIRKEKKVRRNGCQTLT